MFSDITVWFCACVTTLPAELSGFGMSSRVGRESKAAYRDLQNQMRLLCYYCYYFSWGPDNKLEKPGDICASLRQQSMVFSADRAEPRVGAAPQILCQKYWVGGHSFAEVFIFYVKSQDVMPDAVQERFWQVPVPWEPTSTSSVQRKLDLISVLAAGALAASEPEERNRRRWRCLWHFSCAVLHD